MPQRLYPLSDHYDGRLFFNPGVDTDKSLGDLFRWRRQNLRSVWPKTVSNPPAASPPAAVADDQIVFTFIGQATYLIRTPEAVLLTDPIFSGRASPLSFLGPKRVRPPGVALVDLPRIDAVLLSHNHYDHMDLASLRQLHERWKPDVVTGLANGAYLERQHVPGAVELDWWQTVETSGLRITYVPAQHWSSRSLRDRRRMLWGGFVVESAAGRVYFAGDTGFFSGFEAIRSRCGPPDVALLPIGAYEPRWLMAAQHMNPAEAVEAHRVLGARQSLGMHWGTFQLTDEGIEEPLQALDRAKAEAGVAAGDFIAPVPGETVLWQRPKQDVRPALMNDTRA